MNKEKVYEGIAIFVAVILFCLTVVFAGILMRYGTFCESQMPSMQEEKAEY